MTGLMHCNKQHLYSITSSGADEQLVGTAPLLMPLDWVARPPLAHLTALDHHRLRFLVRANDGQ
jgi:hypothetical protein